MTSAEDAHLKVLQLIERQPEISQRELAEQLGVSVGKVNYLLNALIEKGLVKMDNFRRGDGKLRKVAYLLTPTGLAERVALTRRYLARKEHEYEILRTEIDLLRREMQPIEEQGSQ